MSKLIGPLLLVGATLGIGYFFLNYRIEGLGDLTLGPRVPGAAAPNGPHVPAPPAAVAQEAAASATVENPHQPPLRKDERATIRIATIDVGPLDAEKLKNRAATDRLAQLIRQYDVVALQDIRAKNRGVLVDFTERINAEDRYYDFAEPPELGQLPLERHSAFLFDGSSVEIDRGRVYSVADASGTLSESPLVASFRVRGPKTTEAFTFSLINVHLDSSDPAREVHVLADVFRQVRDDGSGEDDVILLGHLGTDDQHLGRLAEVPNITWVVSGVATTTRGTRSVDNLFFDTLATTEFTGRSGLLNLMDAFDVSMREAGEISAHLPVWAEFDIYEGGHPGRVAGEHVPATR
jgi:hypothetical protein